MKPKTKVMKAKPFVNGVQKQSKPIFAKNGGKGKTPNAAKTANKRANKLLEKLAQSDEEVSDNSENVSDNEEVGVSDESVEEENDADLLDNEAIEEEESEMEEDDDDDENEDGSDNEDEGEEEGEDQSVENDDGPDDSNEAPTESPIVKKEQIDGTQDNIKFCKIPYRVPKEKIIIVTNLPKMVQQADIVNAFSKYGPISIIWRSLAKKMVNIVYKNAAGAQAAFKANGSISINNVVVNVSLHNETIETEFKKTLNRCINVRRAPLSTTEQQLREFFSQCGEVESIQMTNNLRKYIRVIFKDKAAIVKAKNLNNAVFNGTNICVTPGDEEKGPGCHLDRDPKRTIAILNVQKHEFLEPDVIQNIFGKCGKISNFSLLCGGKILAIITFATEAGVTNAQKLNGQTINDVKIDIGQFEHIDKKHISVVVKNLRLDTTEEELREFFASAGEIVHVFVQNGLAIIRFKNSDGYCKAFLKHETQFKGRLIFIQPFTSTKKAPHPNAKNLKRPAPARPFRPMQNFKKERMN